MSETRPPGDQISGTITNNSGQAANGKDIDQTQTRIDVGGSPDRRGAPAARRGLQSASGRGRARRAAGGLVTRPSSGPRRLSKRRPGRSRTSR